MGAGLAMRWNEGGTIGFYQARAGPAYPRGALIIVDDLSSTV